MFSLEKSFLSLVPTLCLWHTAIDHYLISKPPRMLPKGLLTWLSGTDGFDPELAPHPTAGPRELIEANTSGAR